MRTRVRSRSGKSAAGTEEVLRVPTRGGNSSRHAADPRVAGVAGVLHLQRAAGNRAVARLLGAASPVAVQRVLIPGVTDPTVLTCTVTGISARHKGGGVYEGLDGKAYSYDGTKLVGGTSAPLGVPFGVATDDKTDQKPSLDTPIVDIESDEESSSSDEESSSSEESVTPVKGPRSPWTTPGGTTRANSPGGTTYQQRSPFGKYKGKPRRRAGGYMNPEHSHGNMLPLWEAAALSPIPKDVNLRAHLMNAKRRFTGTSPGRSRTQEFQGHGQGVLGHEPSASTHWNTVGHTQPRTGNLEHNRSTGAYHGIEYRPWSDASGAHEPRYDSPAPHLGSDPSYWNRSSSGFEGGPWHSWEKDK